MDSISCKILSRIIAINYNVAKISFREDFSAKKGIRGNMVGNNMHFNVHFGIIGVT